jgi:lysocardiolipin and lysophospholipid acyltransferase
MIVESEFQALLNVLGVKIYVSGDHISPYESAVLVMNHRTRVDWNFLWAAMYQACMPSIACHKLKFILKDPIRHIPGPGNF